MQTKPKIFISYSHDDATHKAWVEKLSKDLKEAGIDVDLDQWGTSDYGASITGFMNKSIGSADRVLVICTTPYICKSNKGHGGAGYESNILSAEILNDQSTNRIIPIIRVMDRNKEIVPVFLQGRKYASFVTNESEIIREQTGEEYDLSLKNLIDDINRVSSVDSGVLLEAVPKVETEQTEVRLNVPEEVIIQKNLFGNRSSTGYFDELLGYTFPGVTNIKWFREPEEATTRLVLLLSGNTEFEDNSPIWWWGFGDMHITNIVRTGKTTVLMDNEELEIDKIAVSRGGSYYQSYLYVQFKAMPPTGVYAPLDIDAHLTKSDCCYEEYAKFGEHNISRKEYDDGAAEINGKPMRTNGKASLRVRYLSPYCFIIAAQDSPINNTGFDSERRNILKNILSDEGEFKVMNCWIQSLPKRTQY